MINDIKEKYNPFVLDIQLRLADTDSLGHLSNVAYIEFLETARTEWHAYTKKQRGVLDNGWDWILGEIRIKFKKEGYLSDKLEVLMWCSRIGTKSWNFSYAMINDKSEIIAIAQTTQISYNYVANKSQTIPDDVLQDLQSRQGNSWEEINI
ncbi:MAG: acyl-CoA thioesterase [Candidatus Heimdallarchaeota archaeon]|nr:acyl-CoA thioesterase [Candidatus Heimdallarchaeota archaeon]